MDGQQVLTSVNAPRQYNENTCLPHSVIISRSARVTAMTKRTKARILSFRNTRYSDQEYTRLRMNRNIFIRSCPTVWNKVICDVCYNEITLHQIYFTRNNRFRGKYCHLECAHRKNMIEDHIIDELFNENIDCLTLDQTGNIIMSS